MRLEVIDAGFFKLDGGAMFGVVPKSIWEKLNPPDSKNLCTWAMRLLYIELEERKILIDTGMGNKQNEKFFNHYEPHGTTLTESLHKLNIQKEDITDVFLTHLHFDHVGGALQIAEDKIVPTFKNATYWTNLAQWDWAINPNGREKASFLKENILPLEESGQLKFIHEKEEWIPGLKVKFFHGHTCGMMLPYIPYKQKTIVYCADLLPSVHHIPLPYVMAYDTQPLITLEEKAKFLEEAVLNNYILYLEHDPKNECAQVESTEKGIRLKETFSLNSLK